VASIPTALVHNLAGRTTLGGMAAIVARSRLLVSNDTGISHVAAGLRHPSVIVASGSDVARWAPLDRDLHRVLWAEAACRPCGFDRCPHGHRCARDVTPRSVLAAIDDQLRRRGHAVH
jgi:ADP-heptose:LPS heptosyltransferase